MSLKLEVNQTALMAVLERKIDLMNTKYQQEISRLENRIKDLEQWVESDKADRRKAMEILKGK